MRELLTTQNQNCYRELIEKEAYTRLAWKIKYGKDYPINFITRKKKEAPIPKLPLRKTVLPPVVPARKAPEEGEREKSAGPGLRPTGESPLVMRPVTPQIRGTLYQGFSKEGKGRCLYLQARNQKNPEQKFGHPLLSSWEYGWRLGDFDKEIKSPINGRSGIVKNTFYARNGVFNFPSPTDHLG
ncbi:protein SPMIP1 [Amia ocellicauda]|uniref:protein SPMIP1 n=1 Tax=Amia ocellicauda TaxID=2972642 RepID=UPI0034648301